MSALDVGHGAGMQIEPFLAKDRVPSPSDELVNHDEDPNCGLIDLGVHKVWRIIQASRG
jgi:hypothetical protein